MADLGAGSSLDCCVLTLRGLGIRIEAVSYTTLGEDINGLLWVLLQLFAQATNVNPQVVQLAQVFRAPYLRQQLVVHQHLPGVARKLVKQLVLDGRELDRLAAHGDHS